MNDVYLSEEEILERKTMRASGLSLEEATLAVLSMRDELPPGLKITRHDVDSVEGWEGRFPYGGEEYSTIIPRPEAPARPMLHTWAKQTYWMLRLGIDESDFEPKLHPSVEHLLQFFTYKHLPSHLHAISRPFCMLADDLARDGRCQGPELTVALRKLLEAKDCAVRSALPEAS